MQRTCTNCGVEYPATTPAVQRPTWWYLNGYNGLNGFFCPECYDKVSHDTYGAPRNPEAFNEIAVKQRLQRAAKSEN